MSRSESVLPSAIEAIGDTPLVELRRLSRGMNGRVLAKLEFLNPGLSKKDRIALRMIEEAEALGHIRPGQTVVELTSGNTGTGLAIVCAVKGYPFVAVMSKGNSTERARMMRAFGADGASNDELRASYAVLRERTLAQAQYLGKAVRWYYAAGSTGCIITPAGGLVARTEGCAPLMELPDALPDNIDREWYVREAMSLLTDIGVTHV